MTTIIIGGGWSGLAAAVTLTQYGHPVHLIESAQQLGGRARTVQWNDKAVDNGQHLMIGAYHSLLSLMETLEIPIQRVFNRYPLDITVYDTQFPPLTLSANNHLPWPLSLAWQLVRHTGLTGLRQVRSLQKTIPTILAKADISVEQWLTETDQSERFIKQLWQPLCLAILNTPISSASAHLLAQVLHDSLGQEEAAADVLIPRCALGELFPSYAAEYIQYRGGKISLKTRVNNTVIQNNKVRAVQTNQGQALSADNIIMATPLPQTAQLLKPYLTLPQLEDLPICTVYLHYPIAFPLDQAMVGMTGTLGQWLFDRHDICPGLAAVVISGPGPHQTLSKEKLIQCISAEIHQLFPAFPKAAGHALVIREKRATFAATVDIAQHRPDCLTKIEGLYLAGDAVNNPYPATLEGAIRNGINAAQHILKKTK